MADGIRFEDLSRMLKRGAVRVREKKDLLSRLDSKGGDGDHGTTVARAMDLLEKSADADAPRDMKTLLYEVGWAVMGVDGGATGPLFGSFFMAMSDAVEGCETLDAPALARAFSAGLKGVERNTRARVGDKTLMDALIPAVEALNRSAGEGLSCGEALARAAAAAEEGARSTRNLVARYGRAKNVGEKSLGFEDPGAVSLSLLIKGLSEGVRADG